VVSSSLGGAIANQELEAATVSDLQITSVMMFFMHTF